MVDEEIIVLYCQYHVLRPPQQSLNKLNMIVFNLYHHLFSAQIWYYIILANKHYRRRMIKIVHHF